MRRLLLALACLLLLLIPSPQKAFELTSDTQGPHPAPQDIEVVYSPAPDGFPQDLWDRLTEEDARDEAAKQNKQIAPRLESYRKLVDYLLN